MGSKVQWKEAGGEAWTVSEETASAIVMDALIPEWNKWTQKERRELAYDTQSYDDCQ